jgi:biotin carboxylase
MRLIPKRDASLLMPANPVIIVGTTPDYVAKILDTYPGPALFVLESFHLDNPSLKKCDPSVLLFTSLRDVHKTLNSVKRFLFMNGFSPGGIACFDCEYLILASQLAIYLGLPFPPPDAVIRARNKFDSKKIWKEAGVPSPSVGLCKSLGQAVDFFYRVNKDVVMKPISGSGSELVFHCKNEAEIRESVQILKEQLHERKTNPLFGAIRSTREASLLNPCETWIIEEFIPGPEFSCDFILHDGGITIIRETGKVKAHYQTFGSILAYRLPPNYPSGLSPQTLRLTLKKAATSLGFTWGYFMTDFIIQDNQPVILEMTPRPGGDSIPDLVETATGSNILHIYLDMMSGKMPHPDDTVLSCSESFASLNLFAEKEGIIAHIETSEILSHPSVRALCLKKHVGDRIILPPKDYDNRLIGYCIITPDTDWDFFSTDFPFQDLLKVSTRTQNHLEA